ncbi:MAG: HEAT repeat domain-containing protein [Candidatus Promineifilaceae bacterium]|nr:HEAT repeat domain-containing protein [Candidatus Promineifilaceae bacterium]
MVGTRLISFFQIRAGEERPVMLLIALALTPSLGGAIGSPAVEALFYRRFGVEFLPYMYMALGVMNFVVAMLITALLGRLSKRRLYLGLPVAMAAVLMVCRVLVGLDLTWFYPVLWLIMSLLWTLQATFIWGVAGTIFDTRQAKRLFPLFGAGAILGNALGGLATGPLVGIVGTENLLLVWATAQLIAFGVVTLLVGLMEEPYIPSWRSRPSIGAELQKGFATVRQSTLLRWFSLAAVLMAVLFFSLGFPFSKAVAAQFPDEDAITGFLGVFQGSLTAVALLASLLLANRLYARIGIMGAIMGHALIFLLGFSLLSLLSVFTALLAFRFLQMAWMQGVSSTAFQATFNIVPAERREQTRAFVDGVPRQMGIVLAGVLLAVGERFIPQQAMFLIAAGLALATTLVMWRARRDYRDALVSALRAGQPQVFIGEEQPFGGFGRDAAAVEVATASLDDPDPAVRRVAAHILGRLDDVPQTDRLVVLLDDEAAEVRTAALRALARAEATSALLEVVACLQDPVLDVRLQAIKTLGQLARFPAGLRSHLTPLLSDPDPAIRVQAAGTLLTVGPNEEAEALLIEMARQAEPANRAAALNMLAEAGSEHAYSLAAEALRAPQPAVRYAAAQAIRRADSVRCLEPLIEALADDDSYVRQGVAEAIGQIGRSALDALLEALDEPRLEAGALLALEQLPVEVPAEPLKAYVQERITMALRYHRFWQAAIGWSADGSEAGNVAEGPALALLQRSLRDKALAQGHRALQAVGLLRDRAAIKLARENLASANPTQRANALETLDSVTERDLIRPLLALWEDDQPQESAVADVLTALLDDADPWVRACAALLAGRRADRAVQARMQQLADDDPNEFVRETVREVIGERAAAGQPNPKGERSMDTLPTMTTMERIMALRRVPLFTDLGPSELKHLAAIAGEHHFADGDFIAHQGEPGDESYLIVSGEVRVIDESGPEPQELAVRQPGESVGEMAVISQEPRVASLVAKGSVHLLCVAQNRFESMLRERPEISLALMRVLIDRLKETQKA